MNFRFLLILALIIGFSILGYTENMLRVITAGPILWGKTTEDTKHNSDATVILNRDNSHKLDKEKYNAPSKPKVNFRKDLIKRTVKDKIIKLPIGEKQIGQDITYNREIIFTHGGSGGGGISFIGHIEANYEKTFGHTFNQGITSIDNTTVNAKECKRYRVIVTHYIRKGTVTLNGEEFPFEMIEDADVVVYPADSSCK